MTKNSHFLNKSGDENLLASVFCSTFAASNEKPTETMKKILIMVTIMTSMVLASCNVTRVVTNESQYVQKGDTSVLIQTRIVETYDASRK